MLQLRKGKLPAVPVSLGGDAVAMIRPATTFETDLANARAAKMLLGLIDSAAPVEFSAELFGGEFDGGGLSKDDPQSIRMAGGHLSLLHIAAACTESWSGVEGETGPITKPTLADIALVLRDAEVARRIDAAVRSPVNLEVSNGAAAPGAADDGVAGNNAAAAAAGAATAEGVANG